MKRRRTTLLSTAVTLATVLLPATSQAQTAVNETRPADADVQIEVSEIIVGSLRLVGWDRSEINVSGELGADVERLEIEGDSRSWEITAEWPDWDEDWRRNGRRDNDRDRRRNGDRGRERDLDVNLVISVPRGARVEIEGVTVDVEIDGVDGSIQAETVTGRIDYRGTSGNLELATVTGAIKVTTTAVERIDVETVQGDIEFVGGFSRNSRASFEAVGGSIVLRIPGDTSASFDIETMTGEIQNDFGQEPVRESRWVPSSELSFRLGGGGARVSVETLQGRVELRRQ